MNEYKGKQRGYYTGKYSSKCEDCEELLWGVDKKQKTCEKCSSKIHYPSWLITDMRFPNELKAIKDKGGISIRVNRHNHPNDINPNTEHPSETALDNEEFDYVIDNNGTIEELIEKVKVVLKHSKII
jgi:hypothetical protein